MNDNKTAILAQAFVTNLGFTITALSKSTQMGRVGFELSTEVEENYQLTKSCIDGTTNTQQRLPILRRRAENTLRFMSQVAPKQEWQKDLGDIAREIPTMTDDAIIEAFERARSQLVQSITEYETARTQ